MAAGKRYSLRGEKNSCNDFITSVNHSIKVRQPVIFSSRETATENMVQIADSEYISVRRSVCPSFVNLILSVILSV